MAATGTALVIGADGVLGHSLSERLRGLGYHVAETRRRPTDGSASLDIETVADSWQPPPGITTAYFCAAVTSQMACRISFDRAYAVNVKYTVTLIRRLVDAGIFVVFPSTNLVFDGSQQRIRADAAPSPRTAYGCMKAEAESRLLAIGGGVGIVRLTKVVHNHLPLFVQWRDSLMRGQDVHPFHDMVFAPLPLHQAASSLIAVGHKRLEGIVQVSAQDDISYAQACDLLAENLMIAASRVKPMSWKESDLRPEHVPIHTTLDTRCAEEFCGFEPPKAHAALKAVFTNMDCCPG